MTTTTPPTANAPAISARFGTGGAGLDGTILSRLTRALSWKQAA